MNTLQAKVSFLLFVLFIAFYSTMYNPKLYFVSFLITTFFILLEKTQIIKNINLPFKIPYQYIIFGGFISIGFFYLYNKYFKRERFEDNKKKTEKQKNNKKETLKSIEETLGKKLTIQLNNHIDKLLETQRDDVMTSAKLQMNMDKQNLKFFENKYKIQQEIEKNESKNTKKLTSLDKKNLLLFKQNLAKHMPEIAGEINNEIISLFTEKNVNEKDKLNFIDKLIESIRRSYKILSKEDRMVYVGTTSLIISFAFMLLDISL